MSVTLDDKTSKIFEEIKTLTFLQTANLVKAFEDEFGITAAAPVAAVAAAPAAGGAAAAEEDQASEVTLILKDVGAKKIDVLKVVRELTGLGLKEAKDMVDNVPSNVLVGVDRKKAQEAEEKLKAAGATVAIQ
ncbi:MAG: 50S ribosomal protein L7/L12 [Vampirovibrionales bacterium]|nr:50S ribosomal protein L7/L12 [Vampirovibrionales bacterium]